MLIISYYTRPNSAQYLLNKLIVKTLVIPSTNIITLNTHLISSFLLLTSSQIQSYCIFICFVWYWLLQFFMKLMLVLILIFRIKLVTLSYSLFINLLIQTPSLITWPIAIYSTLVIDIDMVFYFLLDHNTIAPSRKK